jgi:DNA-binding response OmpR family regulator
MAYLFRQKINLSDLAGRQAVKHRVLIHEPESYLAALYEHYLKAHNFDIKHCPDLAALSQSIAEFAPRLLILNAQSAALSGGDRLWAINFKQNFPDLIIVTTGYNLSAQVLSKLMNAGACGHIDRRLSRPGDLVVIVTTLLQQNI